MFIENLDLLLQILFTFFGFIYFFFENQHFNSSVKIELNFTKVEFFYLLTLKMLLAVRVGIDQV